MAQTRSGSSQRRTAQAARDRRSAAAPSKPSGGRRRGAAPQRKPTKPKMDSRYSATGAPLPEQFRIGPSEGGIRAGGGNAGLSTSSRSSAPSAPKLPSRAELDRRASASKPRAAAKPASKPASKPAAAKPKAAETSGIGPVKSGDSYTRKLNSLREQIRKLKEMQASSKSRQGK